MIVFRRLFAVYSLATGEIRLIVGCKPASALVQAAAGEAVCPVDETVTQQGWRIDLKTGTPRRRRATSPTVRERLDAARAQRDRLLAASDWTQALDNRLTPAQRAAWAALREDWRAVVDDIKAGLTPRPWAEAPV